MSPNQFPLPVYDPKLPHMRCDENCGACCGPVVCTAAEMDAVRAFIADRGIQPVRQGITCPLFIGGTCAVYPVRPFACRLFGHSPHLACGRGHNVNVPQKREGKLVEEYGRRFGAPDRWMHALVYGEDEIFGVLAEHLAAKVQEGGRA